MAPYTNQPTRDDVDEEIGALISKINLLWPSSNIDLDGVLNYTISKIVVESMRPPTGWRYHFIARAAAVFQKALAEFDRRVTAPHEDKCIEKNGDVSYYE